MGLFECQCNEPSATSAPAVVASGARGGDSAKVACRSPGDPNDEEQGYGEDHQEDTGSKAAAKVKRRSVAQGRLSRTGRPPAAATADMSGATQTNPPHRTSKKATIEALVRRKGGAAIADLMAATGWQEHSIRAALTGLRKTGHTISRERDDGSATYYRIAEVV